MMISPMHGAPETVQSLPPLRSPRPVNGSRAVLATADGPLGSALAGELRGARWTVREARGAAEMLALLEMEVPAVCFLDSWLPDLDARECVAEIEQLYPGVEVLTLDGADLGARPGRNALRTEALHALRQAQARLDAPAWHGSMTEGEILRRHGAGAPAGALVSGAAVRRAAVEAPAGVSGTLAPALPSSALPAPLPELVGSDPRLLEVSRRIRLVAPRRTPVLIHGATGTGKELVARALHRLSGRAPERLIAINCAAIPEALVEAELFGHAKGAFTGAQHTRIGKIEAAAGGTLFLDEVGELPLPVQAKLLRFLESGTIQRVGENDEIAVDVRVVAATHRKLGSMARDGAFRLDLLHRLSVFLIETPALVGRAADIDALLDHTLTALTEDGRKKRLSGEARSKLLGHNWPGNVRELKHTLERAWILAGEDSIIDAACVDFGESLF